MAQKLTIKAVRRMTSASILPDGTLVKWFDTTREGTFDTLAYDVEIEENFLSGPLTIRGRGADGSGWDYETHGRAQKHYSLHVSTRYAEESGYLPMLKGSRVTVRLPHVEEGSHKTKERGVEIGSVQVRHEKRGTVTFTLVRGMSSPIEPGFSSEENPCFVQIVKAGQYCGRKLTKVTYDATHKCKSCGRPETACSIEPCEAVKAAPGHSVRRCHSAKSRGVTPLGKMPRRKEQHER